MTLPVYESIAPPSHIATFALDAGPFVAGELAVHSFRGTEGISQLFSFEVVCRVDVDPALLEAAVLGEAATLRLAGVAGALPRVVRGIVSSVRFEGFVRTMEGGERRAYTLRVVPRLWLLKRRRCSRIFQNASVTEILAQVASGHGVRLELELVRRYPRRSYCVQHQESDYRFFSRLLAEEGLFFYFEPPASLLAERDGAAPPSGAVDAASLTEAVVICDSPASYPPIAATSLGGSPAVPFRAGSRSVASEESVLSFDEARAVRPKAVHLRDYDFRRPALALDVRARAASSTLDLAATPPTGLTLTSAVVAPIDPLAAERYEHHGEYEEPEVLKQLAETRLEQGRAGARVASGKSNCRRFVAGCRFILEDHAQPELNKEYAIVQVTHTGRITEGMDGARGRAQQVYENEFRCVPSSVSFRPKAPRRRLQQVLESAVVVGPPGEEIHTDEYGRVKVQFHWDRDGQRNENSSCWIRVLQTWAGASWGFQFIPRIGMEVLVSFLGGDEDRPFVIGAAYNATHPTPFPLPGSKTRSGIRTQSTPQGDGYNEIAFEDAKGSEVLAVQAERDLYAKIKNDHTTTVGGDQRLVVEKTQSVRVVGQREDHVEASESRAVDGARTTTIGGDDVRTIGGRNTTLVDGAMRTSVRNLNLHSRGDHVTMVDGFCSTSVGTPQNETALAYAVQGTESHDVTKSITLRSDTQIVFECGSSSLIIGPDSIAVHTKTVVVNGSDSVTLFGNGPALRLSDQIDATADTINAFTQGGVVELDKNGARLQGPQVDICTEPDGPPSITDSQASPSTKKFKWTFLDEDRAPLANKTYRLLTQGLKLQAVTDGNGKIDLDVPLEATSADVMLWCDDFPTGRTLRYAISLAPIPSSSSVGGAQARLRNLGYYFGREGDTLTPELAAALQSFQCHAGLPPTGQLDGATIAKLDDVHPSA